MGQPPRGRADYLALGDYNALCFECGKKFKASELRKHWQGYYVCPEHWEKRHPQDFVKSIPDVQTPPWAQTPPAYIFSNFCTPEGVTAVSGWAIPTCATPSFFSPALRQLLQQVP